MSRPSASRSAARTAQPIRRKLAVLVLCSLFASLAIAADRHGAPRCAARLAAAVSEQAAIAGAHTPQATLAGWISAPAMLGMLPIAAAR